MFNITQIAIICCNCCMHAVMIAIWDKILAGCGGLKEEEVTLLDFDSLHNVPENYEGNILFGGMDDIIIK